MEAALALIGTELKQVEEQFRKDLASDVPLIRKVGEYVLSSGGKRIRPQLLLFVIVFAADTLPWGQARWPG